MGDRKFSFRFWSSGTRQQPASQNTVAPSTTINSTPPAAPRAESRSVNRPTTRTTNATSSGPRKAENKTPDRQSTSSTTNPTPTTPPTAGKKTPASRLISNTTNSTSTTPPTFENKTPDGRTTLPKAENKTLDSQNASNPTSTTSPPIENKIFDGQSNSNTTNPISTAPPTPEKKTLDSQPTNPTNNPSQPTTPSMKEEQVANKQNTIVPAQVTPASTDVQTSKTADTTFTSPTKEPKSSSPSRASTRSTSSSQPVAPSRRTRSPPQRSSPSSKTPQARSTLSSLSHMGSQTPSTPHRAPQPRSTNLVGSHTPKHTSSSNPSKESRSTTQEMSTSQEAPTSGSQHEPRLKSDGANDNDDQTKDGTSSMHNEVEVMPSKSSQLGTTTTQNVDSSTVNGRHEAETELNAKPEETKDVKEVVQARNTKANEEAKNEITPKCASEAQITWKAISLPNAKPTNTMSQTKKRSAIPNNHKESVLPIGEHVTSHKYVRDDISSFVNRMGIGDLKGILYDKPVSIITVAGENRGASMQMGSNSSSMERPVHIHRSYKINPDESVEAITDGDGSSKGKRSEDANDQPPEAYVNNNAQGINNSIVLNSSVIERNPGVHMVVSHPLKEPIQSTDRASSLGIGKSENNMARIDKLTYQPTVRRRCLRGLFLETSDSDPENSIKPRRHGCRLSCQQKDKENDRDDL